ncbi:flagellar biosynthetic protein FliO [Plastoroseomonas hellenica]|uniref:flagellar biosynthetic protein FliO n=1 Tax=Plastoroseomonas hellenica TaxID=2687306 RepID=UPI001BA7B50B|nr:flagellar biosynthetic protein FliO [Plastoroseomonas hellenica]MBR0643443.1 flagellar biosynthetic protein FliO [Plastoroseomonas hellenica]
MYPSQWITTQWLWAGLALAGIVALLLLLARGARAAGLAPRMAGQRMRVEETLALDARRRLLLVHVDGERLLLLTGGNADQSLGWVPRAAKVDEA